MPTTVVSEAWIVGALAAYRRILDNRPLSRLLVGEFVSSVGDWLYLVALLIVVYRESADPVLLGIVGAARVLPYVLLSIPAGIVADRYDRRLVLLVTDVARGVIMLVLAWLVAADAPVAWVIVMSIVAGCFSAFFSPTIGAYLPSIVGNEAELGPANSAWSTLDNLAFIIGPAIAGLLIATSGLTAAFVLNAASFAILAVVLWGLPSVRAGARESAAQAADDSAPADADTAAARESLIDIVRPVLGLALADVTAGFAFGGLGVLTVLLAINQLGAGEEGTGYLNAGIGVGAVVGAVLSGALSTSARQRTILLAGLIVFAAGLVLLGVVSSLAVAFVAMAIASAGSLVAEVISTTIFQRLVPDAVRGRALGVAATLTTLAYAAGSLVLPVFAGWFGIASALVASAVVVVAGAVGGVAMLGAAWSGGPGPEVAHLARRLTGLPLFAGVPEDRLAIALSRAKPVAIRAGDTIVRQGEPADRFYVILDGQFVVSDDQAGSPSRQLRTLGPNDAFGELGLLTGAPRTATVTAASDGRLLALEANDFLELVSSAPDLRPRLLALYRGAPTAVRTVADRGSAISGSPSQPASP
ncbi:MAG TPA: MFS transporter [Methylomirabilota bacterium]|nr:MFS transporter [Methylomirabilota bacterium]